VVELFGTADGLHRNADLLRSNPTVRIDEISEKAASSLSETVTPQGLIAVCRAVDVSLESALGRRPRLVAVLVDANDPGNAGAILRTTDAAGADTVIFAGDSVDPYNGKAVRASAGSLFHLDVVTGMEPLATIKALRNAGLLALAATGSASTDLDELVETGQLRQPTAWLFGNEAHGLSDSVIDAADAHVRVPIHGMAESLNLAAAAAVCLYASAREQRR
jgi:TrmH family RNA methyltransferase